ncbi:MAG: transposase zinc-binding domain-containing protein [Desulfobacterales bacterium]
MHLGFARVRGESCGYEFLLPFSCERRHFCPSCHQKRVIEFGQWLCEDINAVFLPARQPGIFFMA